MKLAVACAIWAAMAIALVALAIGLPPDTFFVGDPGVKLVAARHAIAHPSRPLELPLPVVGGKAVPYVEPFFAVHGDHVHAVTSDLFPLVSAPFIAAFGLRGAYVLPAIGFLMAIAGCAWLGTTLDNRRHPAVVIAVAALATPFLFYGLEFWEHAPAVGLAALATALFVRFPARLAFPSGVLLGVAALLRPEAVFWSIAVLASTPLLRPRPRRRAVMAAAAGFAVAWLPEAAYTIVHFGTVLPPHVSVNLAGSNGDWSVRRLVQAWFVTLSPANFFRVAPAALLALVALPRMERNGRWFLRLTALLSVALVILTAPNDGGGQWGPRYLLFAYIPLTVLVADGIEALARLKLIGVTAAGLIFLGSAWVQRTAYEDLRGTKLAYQRVLGLVRDEVPAGASAVTDVWWLDQVAAAATTDRQILFAPDAKVAAVVMKQLDEAGEARVTTLQDTTGARASAPSDVASWVASTCYVEEVRRETLAPRLLAIRFQRRCGKER